MYRNIEIRKIDSMKVVRYKGLFQFCDLLDVNECVRKICHQNATCLNLNGSYNCTCNENFVGDGMNCEGKFLLT